MRYFKSGSMCCGGEVIEKRLNPLWGKTKLIWSSHTRITTNIVIDLSHNTLYEFNHLPKSPSPFGQLGMELRISAWNKRRKAPWKVCSSVSRLVCIFYFLKKGISFETDTDLISFPDFIEHCLITILFTCPEIITVVSRFRVLVFRALPGYRA